MALTAASTSWRNARSARESWRSHRLSISANRLLDESAVPKEDGVEQIDLFTNYADREKQKAEASATHARERRIQETMLDIKKKYGKNAILKGMNLEEGATAKERNETIGGHQA